MIGPSAPRASIACPTSSKQVCVSPYSSFSLPSSAANAPSLSSDRARRPVARLGSAKAQPEQRYVGLTSDLKKRLVEHNVDRSALAGLFVTSIRGI